MKKTWTSLFLFLVPLAIWSQGPNTPIPVSDKVKIGVLDNGLKYYLRQNPKPENKVELRLVVNAGSILEDERQLGLAHFLEHMAFNGTKSFSKNDIVSFLQSIGVEFGADLNAESQDFRTAIRRSRAPSMMNHDQIFRRHRSIQPLVQAESDP